LKIDELQQRAKANKRDSSGQIGPVSRQQNAGNDDGQRIEKVEKSIDAAGDIDQRRDKRQVSKNLDNGLVLGLLPERDQKHEEERNRKPDDNYGLKQTDIDVVGRQPG